MEKFSGINARQGCNLKARFFFLTVRKALVLLIRETAAVGFVRAAVTRRMLQKWAPLPLGLHFLLPRSTQRSQLVLDPASHAPPGKRKGFQAGFQAGSQKEVPCLQLSQEMELLLFSSTAHPCTRRKALQRGALAETVSELVFRERQQHLLPCSRTVAPALLRYGGGTLGVQSASQLSLVQPAPENYFSSHPPCFGVDPGETGEAQAP